MNFKSVILLICSLVVGIATNAQLSFASLQDVWVYAETHNIQIRALSAAKSVAVKNVRQAYGSLLPTISANGSFTDNVKIQPTLVPANLFNPAAPSDSYTEATFGRRYLYNCSFSAQFDLLNTRDWFNVKAEKFNAEIAALNISKAKADLFEQLASAFFSFILFSQAEKLSNENLAAATALHQSALNKNRQGLVSQISVNTAAIHKEKAVQSLNLARHNKWLQYNAIRLLLNTPDSIVISDNVLPAMAAPIDSALAPDPGIALARVQMLAAKAQWQSSKAAFMPTLSAVYQVNTQVATDQFLGFENSNTMPQQYWGLRLSVPIFQGSIRYLQIQKARIDFNLKQAQYEASKLQSAIMDQNVWQSYASAKAAFDTSEEILRLYRDNDVHADRRMKSGLISIDERLSVYSDLISSQNDYLESMSDFFLQQYRLRIRQTTFTK